MSDLADRALAAFHQGQIPQASRLAREALAANQTDASAAAVLGLIAAGQQSHREAQQFLTLAVEGGAASAEVMRAYGRTYALMNGRDQMLAHLAALLEGQPDNADYRFALTEARFETGDVTGALAACEAGMDEASVTDALLMLYGTILRAADRLDDALAVFDRYVQRQPGDPDGHYMRGISLLALGDVEDARAAFLDAMAQQPFHPWSFYSFMRSGKVKDDEPLVAKFDQVEVLLRNADDQSASFLYYGMGKALEDLGRYDDAWNCYEKGRAKRSKSERYKRRETEQRFARIRTLFSQESFAQLAQYGNPEARPIFIVGMPRSGSTLTEQILAGHSQVAALGELLDFDKLCEPWTRPTTNMNAIPWRELGDRYLELTSARRGDATYLVDKGLHNFMHIGFIHVLFPNATILHTVRDPLDTCVSSLTVRFASGHTWANRVRDTAHYYGQYRALMEYWGDVLPGRIIEARYEDLTSNFELQARRLVAACGLPWEEACLDFAGRDRAVRTASAAQVRTGVGSSSVTRWKKFEPHLDELKQDLKPYL